MDRPPVSVNATYKRGAGKSFYKSKEAKEFSTAVFESATAAALTQRWPNVEKVGRVAVSITVFNTRHDVDAPIKSMLDSIEGVAYLNDRSVSQVLAQKGSDPTGKPRIDVEVTQLDA